MIPPRRPARRAVRRNARRRLPTAAVESLESRRLLAAAGTRTVTAAENGMAVTVDSTEFSLVEVQADADVGTLTIQGSECAIEVVIRGSASSLNVQGGAAGEVVTIAAGGSVGTATFQGGGGNDYLINRGTIDGSLTFNGDAGDDFLQVTDGGAVVGGISGSGGAGGDTVEVTGSAVIDNFNFDLDEGDDTFLLSSDETTTGNFELRAGDGNDTATFADGAGIGGQHTVDLGAGDDELTTDGLTVEGNQAIDLGESGDSGDTLTLGGDTIEGGSSVDWAGDVEIDATGARDIESDYTFKGVGGGTSDAMLDTGSVVGGNFSWTTDGETTLVAGLTITEGNATINTGTGSGTGADEVTLADGFAVGGNLTVTLGGDESLSDALRLKGDVRVGDPDENVNGNMTVALGGGDDVYRAERLVVNGNQTLNLGASGTESGGGLGGKNSVRFAEATVNGGVTVNWAGGLDARETAARDIASDLTFNGSEGDGGMVKVFVDEGSTVGGNFTFTAPTRTVLEMGLTVNQGNATISTGTGSGSGPDTLRVLDGTSVGGNFSATLGGSESTRDVIEFGEVSVGDPATGVNGNMTLAVGGGADKITFDALTLNGNQTIELGDSGPGEDVLRFGEDRIEGGSNVTWAGDADLRESAAREIAGDYTFGGSDGEATAMLDAGSTVDGNFNWTSAGATTLALGLTVNQGNLTVGTGSGAGTGADEVTVRGGTRVGGNAKFALGGGEDDADKLRLLDEVFVGDVENEVNGNFTATLGGGSDVFVSDALTVNGNQTVDLGSGGGPGRDVARFGADVIEGSSTVEWSADARVVERDAREIAGSYLLNGGNRDAFVELLGTTLTDSGNLSVTNSGRLRLTSAVRVESGNATITGGGGDGEYDLAGMLVDGNLNVSAGGGDDVLDLGDAEVRGNLSATLGAGDDAVENAAVVVDGTETYRGGPGRDTIARREGARARGF